MTNTPRNQAPDKAALADELEQCHLLKRVPGLGEYRLDQVKHELILAALRATPPATAAPEDDWEERGAADDLRKDVIEECANAAAKVWTGNDFALRDQVTEAIRSLRTASPAPHPDKAGNEREGMAVALHPDTANLVRDFAAALAIKLRSAELKYGYATGWRDDDWEDKCKSDLIGHVMKGDPLDVAAFAAFCWKRGWSTTPSNPDHEEAFLPIFERWADCMLIGQPDREILREDVRRATAIRSPPSGNAVAMREALEKIKRCCATGGPRDVYDLACDALAAAPQAPRSLIQQIADFADRYAPGQKMGKAIVDNFGGSVSPAVPQPQEGDGK